MGRGVSGGLFFGMRKVIADAVVGELVSAIQSDAVGAALYDFGRFRLRIGQRSAVRRI